MYIQPCVRVADALFLGHGSILFQIQVCQAHLRIAALVAFHILASGNHPYPAALWTNVYFHHIIYRLFKSLKHLSLEFLQHLICSLKGGSLHTHIEFDLRLCTGWADTAPRIV